MGVRSLSAIFLRVIACYCGTIPLWALITMKHLMMFAFSIMELKIVFTLFIFSTISSTCFNWLWDNSNLIIYLQGFQEWVVVCWSFGRWCIIFVFVHNAFCNYTMSWINMVLEQFIHSECGSTHGTFIRQMCWL